VVVDSDVFQPEPPIDVISSAMAAFTHAVEGFVGVEKNRFMDAYARTAIQMIMGNLIGALNRERGWKFARSAVAIAETMAGCVYANMSPGLTQRLSLAIAQKTSWSQGICMGILLPYVLDHLSSREDYFVSSLLLPMAGPETCSITASEYRVGKALTMIQELQFALYELSKNKLPMTLEDVGINSEQLKPMVTSFSQDTMIDVNEETLLMILERALKGDPIDVH
jgi:alcohol dehydrogenase class IV